MLRGQEAASRRPTAAPCTLFGAIDHPANSPPASCRGPPAARPALVRSQRRSAITWLPVHWRPCCTRRSRSNWLAPASRRRPYS